MMWGERNKILLGKSGKSICVVACLVMAVGLCVAGGAASAQSVVPKQLSADDLKKLRWIEGTWRGTGDVEQPFYERYHFENDAVLVVESFADEKLSKVDDVTRFELKDGHFGNGGEGSRWVVTELTAGSVTFSPAAKARNTFRWEKETDRSWKAVLDWPATAEKPARQRVYKMEPWPPAQPPGK
jgi:hypothetical protein